MQSSKSTKPPGKFFTIISWLIGIASVIFISILLSIIIEWLGIFFDWWPQPNHLHAKAMFTTEINWVLGDFLSHNHYYKKLFLHFFENGYRWFIKGSGLEYISNHIDFFVSYVLAAIYIIEVVMVRLLIIVCALPVFFLINSLLVVDGLLVREVRKLSGGTESAFIYHHSKRWIKPLIGLPIVLLLASPISVHPSIFILVISLVPGYFIWLSVGLFKKHL